MEQLLASFRASKASELGLGVIKGLEKTKIAKPEKKVSGESLEELVEVYNIGKPKTDQTIIPPPSDASDPSTQSTTQVTSGQSTPPSGQPSVIPPIPGQAGFVPVPPGSSTGFVPVPPGSSAGFVPVPPGSSAGFVPPLPGQSNSSQPPGQTIEFDENDPYGGLLNEAVRLLGVSSGSGKPGKTQASTEVKVFTGGITKRIRDQNIPRINEWLLRAKETWDNNEIEKLLSGGGTSKQMAMEIVLSLTMIFEDIEKMGVFGDCTLEEWSKSMCESGAKGLLALKYECDRKVKGTERDWDLLEKILFYCFENGFSVVKNGLKMSLANFRRQPCYISPDISACIEGLDFFRGCFDKLSSFKSLNKLIGELFCLLGSYNTTKKGSSKKKTFTKWQGAQNFLPLGISAIPPTKLFLDFLVPKLSGYKQVSKDSIDDVINYFLTFDIPSKVSGKDIEIVHKWSIGLAAKLKEQYEGKSITFTDEEVVKIEKNFSIYYTLALGLKSDFDFDNYMNQLEILATHKSDSIMQADEKWEDVDNIKNGLFPIKATIIGVDSLFNLIELAKTNCEKYDENYLGYKKELKGLLELESKIVTSSKRLYDSIVSYCDSLMFDISSVKILSKEFLKKLNNTHISGYSTLTTFLREILFMKKKPFEGLYEFLELPTDSVNIPSIRKSLGLPPSSSVVVIVDSLYSDGENLDDTTSNDEKDTKEPFLLDQYSFSLSLLD